MMLPNCPLDWVSLCVEKFQSLRSEFFLNFNMDLDSDSGNLYAPDKLYEVDQVTLYADF